MGRNRLINQNPTPPKFAIFLLEQIYDAELFDEVYGDLFEIFNDRIQKHGQSKASLYFLWDAILSIRNYDLKKKKEVMKGDTWGMLRNYLKTTWRNISKNKVYSGLNIMGLALGIAACIFILQYVSYEKSYDLYHENQADLYRVIYKNYDNGALQFECAAAVPRVGPFMKEKMPEVIDFARAFPMSGVVTYDDRIFREERMHMADPSILKLFTFPLIMGDPETALHDPNSVVITESIAHKYFGNENPMGEILEINGRHKVLITGVAKDVPENSHFKFNFLISYETQNNQNTGDDGTIYSESSWGWYDYNTYVLLQPGTDVAAFDRQFDQYINEEHGEDFAQYSYRKEFPLQPIADIHLYSNLLQESEPEEQGDGRAVSFLSLVALFIMIIAWINYVNLATARSVERAKEVGVRKTLGATKKQLIYQFLTESFVLNTIALVLGIGIVVLGIGYFNQLTNAHLDLAFLVDGSFWGSILGVLFIGALFSGLYPAFILSSFDPISVLKGRLSTVSGGNKLRKGLVVFQFAASITLIASTIIVYQQLAHMHDHDLGFDMTEKLVVKGPEVIGVDSLFESTNETFKNELMKNPRINAVAAGSNVPGNEIFWTNGISRPEEGNEAGGTIYIAGVDYNYFPTYGINFLAGRNYNREFLTDTAAIILNKAGVSFVGFSSPEEAIGKQVDFWGTRTIVGVVDDYNQMSAKGRVAPMVFPLTPRISGYYTINIGPSDFQSTLSDVQATFHQHFPGNPFDYFFLDDYFNRQYNNDQTFSKVFTLFAAFAIFIACLGLFGLSSFNALKRTKEIGIRKVLGANISTIIQLLSKEFVLLVVIANLVAWPIIYFLMIKWLNGFATRIAIGFPTLIISGAVVLLISILTVGHTIYKAATTNPVEAIQYE